MNIKKIFSILLGKSLFIFVFFVLSLSAEEKKNIDTEIKKKTSSKSKLESKKNIDYFSGSYLLFLPGFYNTKYSGDFLPPRESIALGGAIEHLTRINPYHEFVIGVMKQWNQGREEINDSSLVGYYFIWRYHIPPFIIAPYYSLFFDFSMGFYDFEGGDLTGRLRSGAFGIGLGNRITLKNNLILQLGIRLRNLQFYLPGRQARVGETQGVDHTGVQIMDTIAANLGIGYRYYSW